MNKIAIYPLFPRTEKFQVELPNESNVSIIELTILDEHGNQKINIYGFDGNLMIENLLLPPFFSTDEDDEDRQLLKDCQWVIPYLDAVDDYIYNLVHNF